MTVSHRELEIVGRSGAFAIRGGFDIAEAMLRAGPQNSPFVLFNLGWHICRRGDWRTATQYLDMGRLISCYGDYPPICHIPVYDGQDLEGKTLHFRCEWGQGDQIMFARFAREFQKLGAEVTISCAKELMPVLGQLAPCVPRSQTFKMQSDYWVPSLQCPRWFPVTGEPYLAPDAAHVEKWHGIIGKNSIPKIGIRWSGNPNYPMEALRRFPAEPMIDLHKLNVGQFYSFQRDDNLKDLPAEIIDLKDRLESWSDTSAALSLMDLVITSDTSVAHLSASMGKPTWIVIPIMPGWQWAMPGERTPWYESARLFRQQTFGEWAEPFDKLREQLKLWHLDRS